MKQKLSHAEREHLAMARNALKRAERVTAAQERNAAQFKLQQEAVAAEHAKRLAEIEALPPAAQELVRKQASAMTTSRQRFSSLLAIAAAAALPRT